MRAAFYFFAERTENMGRLWRYLQTVVRASQVLFVVKNTSA